MPNGKPGDHPLTDILVHGASIFSPEIDSLVRELAAMPDFDQVRERVATLLWDNWPAWQNARPDLLNVRQELAIIKAELVRVA